MRLDNDDASDSGETEAVESGGTGVHPQRLPGARPGLAGFEEPAPQVGGEAEPVADLGDGGRGVHATGF
ncbi:hypothetical protein [Corynebacterium variabile]